MIYKVSIKCHHIANVIITYTVVMYADFAYQKMQIWYIFAAFANLLCYSNIQPHSICWQIK